MARFEVPDGWTVQAFLFTLDPTTEQAACVRRQFCARLYGRRSARHRAAGAMKVACADE